MDAIKTAIIGMGNMGSQYAAYLLSGKVPGMELAAVTRIRPEQLLALDLTLPGDLPVFSSADALFDALDAGRIRLDAVIIATPHRLHEEQSIAAMNRAVSSVLIFSINAPFPLTAGSARLYAARAWGI